MTVTRNPLVTSRYPLIFLWLRSLLNVYKWINIFNRFIQSKPSANHITQEQTKCLLAASLRSHGKAGGLGTHLLLVISYWSGGSVWAVLGKLGTWQDLGQGARHPKDTQPIWKSTFLLVLHKHTRSCLILLLGWSVSCHTLNCSLFRFPTVGSLSYLCLLWKRPSSHAVTLAVFGNRPADQEGPPYFQWGEGWATWGDVLWAPTAQLESRTKGGLGWRAGNNIHCCCWEGIQFIQVPKQQYL